MSLAHRRATRRGPIGARGAMKPYPGRDGMTTSNATPAVHARTQRIDHLMEFEYEPGTHASKSTAARSAPALLIQ